MEHDEDIDADWTAKELSVLRSAELDVPPRGSLDRTLTAIGVGAALGASVGTATTLSGAAKLGGLTRWSAAFKWLTASVAGAGLVSALYLSRRHLPGVASTVPRSAPVVASVPVNPTSAPAIPLDAPAVTPETAAVAPTNSAPLAARADTPAREPSKDALAAEIRLIDDARARLRRGDAQGSLQTLAQYDQLVGHGGSMRAEATVVRIEALQASGDGARASALGQRFVSKNPSSPYADYVKRILARAN